MSLKSRKKSGTKVPTPPEAGPAPATGDGRAEDPAPGSESMLCSTKDAVGLRRLRALRNSKKGEGGPHAEAPRAGAGAAVRAPVARDAPTEKENLGAQVAPGRKHNAVLPLSNPDDRRAGAHGRRRLFRERSVNRPGASAASGDSTELQPVPPAIPQLDQLVS